MISELFSYIYSLYDSNLGSTVVQVDAPDVVSVGVSKCKVTHFIIFCTGTPQILQHLKLHYRPRTAQL